MTTQLIRLDPEQSPSNVTVITALRANILALYMEMNLGYINTCSERQSVNLTLHSDLIDS